MTATNNFSEQTSAPLILRAQYIKDLSFENPDPIESLSSQDESQPNIGVSVQAKAQNFGGRNFEVVLEIRADAKRDEKVLFIAELVYAGILTVGDQVSEENIAPLVMIEGPHLLFPFARNIIADVTRDGGFPPLMLAPMDFANLYLQQQAA